MILHCFTRSKPYASLNNILAVILGGGVGKRLYPLTEMRSKPAVPIAGKYRLIDVPISNCINSGINRIAVLTQFNSVSLHRHITQTYQFDAFHIGWVQILAAEQTPRSTDWYQGTADAVRKQLMEIKATSRICPDFGRRSPVPHGLRQWPSSIGKIRPISPSPSRRLLFRRSIPLWLAQTRRR